MMQKNSKRSYDKGPYALLFILLVASVLFFAFMYLYKIRPALQAANKTIRDIAELRPTPYNLYYGDQDAPVTVIAYSGFTCKECREYYDEIFINLKEDYILEGRIRYYYMLFLHDADIGSESLEYNISRYLYCSAGENDPGFWDTYEFFFNRSEEDALKLISNGKLRFEECYEHSAREAVGQRHSENSFFGINSQPSLAIGIENTENTLLVGLPSNDTISRAIRRKEIALGKG